jgi:hypothetical protein
VAPVTRKTGAARAAMASNTHSNSASNMAAAASWIIACSAQYRTRSLSHAAREGRSAGISSLVFRGIGLELR